MPTLPIPMISSIFLGFLLVRMWMTKRRYGPLVVLLFVCAIQGIIISMAQHYAVPVMRFVQPVTATFIPPLAWVAFQSTAVRRFLRRDFIHLSGPVCAATALAIHPIFLDTLIPGLFVGYGFAILWQALKGADALPRMRLEAGDLPVQIWLVIAASLILSALSDILIVVAQTNGAPWLQPWIISVYSSGMLLVVGGLSLAGALESDSQPSEDQSPEGPQISEHDTRIVAQLDAYMDDHKPYLNPDLTLSQLSRKLVVPVKHLSGAINRVTGENVSRYINKARVEAAQQALKEGDNITSAMFRSGFNTKSNFNREFLRVAGCSPSDWVKQQGQP